MRRRWTLRFVLLRLAVAAPIVAALALSPACTNFQDPTTVLDLRVLSVVTEPSEVILDVDLTDPRMPIVNPASNPEITVTPLIVDPAGSGRPVTYTVLACPNDPFAAAPPGPGMGGGAFPSGGARTTVGSALCDETSPNTWTLVDTPVNAGESVVVHPTADQLKAAFMSDIFPDQYLNLHGGFDLGEPFMLQLRVDAGGERLDVVKRVLYWARPIDAGQQPNNRPIIGGVTTYPDRDPKTALPIGTVSPLVEGTPLDVPAGGSVWIEPAAATAESYWTTILDATTHLAVPTVVERETLRYAFYATGGRFEPPRTTSELTPGFEGTVHLESKYVAPAMPVAPDVTIWIVVRDDRGGESWVTRTLRLTPAP